MNFTLVKGDMAHLDEYRAIFFDSKLYDAYFAEDDRLEKSLRHGIETGSLYIAMSSSGEPIAAMHMTMDGMADLPYVHLLGVKKNYRGMGIGRDLLRIFIGTAEAQGAPNMFILTSHFNVRAKKLYQSMGFKPYCLLPDLLKKGVSEWLMMRPAKK